MSPPNTEVLSHVPRLSSDYFAGASEHGASPAARLAEEMAACWRRGERPTAEDFLNRRPELWDQTEAALHLVYEEICLRQELGETDAAGTVTARFPQWRTQLGMLLDCHRLLHTGPAKSRAPVVGETVGEFRLLAELGRGAVGGVFLAAQPALADRPVVLKVTPRAGSEHLSLARLQHTHIVPLYSALDDPDRGLRVLCMPYFGGAALARLHELLVDVPPSRRTGRDLLAALDHVQAGLPVQLPARGPAREFLERASFADAVGWIGLCLAEALHYAHERGLLHLDLKPANVLLAADGTPMLLDFHLARPPLPAGAPATERLGGTPLYMAPEQARALEAFHRDAAAPAGVDGRADVYALGLTLYQFLGGSIPFTAGSPSLLSRENPQVSVGLGDLLHKCLARDPARRYASAAALADDLRRHLNDLPLRGVPNRSQTERWRKWRRRRPNALLVAAGVLAVVAAGAVVTGQFRQRYAEPERALVEGRELRQRGEFARAIEALERGRQRADALPFRSAVRQALADELDQTRKAEAARQDAVTARELHVLAERIRFASAADPLSAETARDLDGPCRALWAVRDRVLDLTADGVRADLMDVAIIGAAVRVRLAPPGGEADAHQEALRVLDEAHALLGPSAALELERAEHARALGVEEPPRLAAPPPRTAWEHVVRGRALMRADRLEPAAEAFARAVELDPANFWGHFHRGRCAYRLDRPADAWTAFTVCAALVPDAPACFYNRGLAAVRLGRYTDARSDFLAALARGADPDVIRTQLTHLDRLTRDP
jgi:serine/threonine protein kinase